MSLLLLIMFFEIVSICRRHADPNGVLHLLRTLLKTGHSTLKFHKSKIDTETSPECPTCKVKETPVDFLLNCKEYDDTERAKLEKDII